jgi:hypothetical protein
MSFFERYFAALDGPEPLSCLELVDESVSFSIHWSDGTKSREFTGGRDELARFTEAGDTSGWAHHVLWSARTGDVEFALGETRWDDGRRIGTFIAAAQLGHDGRMVRYLTARSPLVEFEQKGDTDD